MHTSHEIPGWHSVWLAAVTAFFLWFPAAGAQSLGCGDCNGDGQISVVDALLAAQHGVGTIVLVSPEFEFCDVEADFGDGDVDVLDSLRIAQVAVGLLPAPLCTPAADPLIITQVNAPMCVGSGQVGVQVTVDVMNPNPDPATITGGTLSFTGPTGADLTTEYFVIPDPGNPGSIAVGASESFLFIIVVSATPSTGPITVDASFTGIDTGTGSPLAASGALSPAHWVIARLYADFETGPQGFVATGDWQRGNPMGLLPPKPSPTMFGTIIAGPYSAQGSPTNPSGRSTLDSPPVSLVGALSPVLSIVQFRDCETPDWDGGNLKASTDGGVTFSSVLPPIFPPYQGSIATGFGNPLSGEFAYVGGSGGVYEGAVFDLSSLVGSTAILRFDFGADNFATGNLGWYLDDVSVCDFSGLPPGKATNPTPPNGAIGVIALPSGIPLGWSPAPLADTYDIYMDTVNPPVALLASGVLATSELLPTPATSTTYYWRVDSSNAFGTTLGDVWSFTTTPFAGLPRVLINEVFTGAPDYVELFNVETVPVDISGWQLTPYNDAVGVPDGTFVFPPGTIVPPSAFVAVYDGGSPPPGGFVSSFNISYTDLSQGEVLLQYPTGAGIDFVGFNTTSFVTLPPDQTFTASAALNIAGAGIAARVDFVDTDDVSDWQATSTPTPQAENPAQPAVSPPGQPFAPQPDNGASGVLSRGTGHRLVWTPGTGITSSFEVFFDVANPPVASLGTTASTTRMTPALSTSTTYYWRVDATNGAGTTPGQVWSFTTSAVVEPRVILNEIGTGGPDFVELLNLSGAPVNVGNWSFEFFQNGSSHGVYTLPPGTMISTLGFRVVADGSLGGAFVTPFNILWSQNNGTAECIVRDASGRTVDYVAATSAIGGGPAPSARTPETVYLIDTLPRMSFIQIAVARTTRGDSDRAGDFVPNNQTPGAFNPGQ